MKTNKQLGKLLTIACMIFVCNGISHANNEKNTYIDEYPPVFTNQWSYEIKEEAWYDPESEIPYFEDVVGSFTLHLINQAEKKYNLSGLVNILLGFSKEDSKIQVYAKGATFYERATGGNPFGEPIPLVPGEYTVEGKSSSLGNYRVTVVIEKEQLDIKEAEKGWIYTTYASANVYMVYIKNAEEIKS